MYLRSFWMGEPPSEYNYLRNGEKTGEQKAKEGEK